MIGPQAEIGAGGKTGYAGLWWQARTGRVEQAVEPAVFEKLLKPDDYNAMTVRCVGKHVRIMLNGTLTVETDILDVRAFPVARSATRNLEAQENASAEIRRALAFDVASSFFAVLSDSGMAGEIPRF